MRESERQRIETESGRVFRATVLSVDSEGAVLVSDGNPDHTPVSCQMLNRSDGSALVLVEGDAVLVWAAPDRDIPSVVLGRLGPSRAPDAPDELVIEAKRNLTIKCGEGSITIREDGKILIKGKDLVCRAQRTARIKGGSVELN